MDLNADKDKAMRGRLHKSIRHKYPDMESETKMIGEVPHLSIYVAKPGKYNILNSGCPAILFFLLFWSHPIFLPFLQNSYFFVLVATHSFKML